MPPSNSYSCFHKIGIRLMIPFGRWCEVVTLVFTLAVLTFAPASGQSRITGTVVDATSGAPLPGTNVFIEGQLQGTASDDEGRFTLTDLPTGRHTVVASMVGYANESETIRLKPDLQANQQAVSVQFELEPDPIEMKGVSVEDSREEWLERLERFRESFFGTAPNSDECSFVNPEVLSFEERGDLLIASAENPLRVHNEALGYELTFHLPHYETSPDIRARYGPVEFDTLEAQTPGQRRAWAEARRETYRGSYEHFVDALVADSLKEEGFRYWFTRSSSFVRTGGMSGMTGVTDASKIVEPASLSGYIFLTVPDLDDNLAVRYTRKGESRVYAERFGSRASKDHQISLLVFSGKNRLILNKKTGTTFNGRIAQRGYWGWYETAATVLPYSYRPPNEL